MGLFFVGSWLLKQIKYNAFQNLSDTYRMLKRLYLCQVSLISGKKDTRQKHKKRPRPQKVSHLKVQKL
jgi:hypothetical protein